MKAGAQLTSDDVRSIRPGHGLAPQYREAAIGRVAVRDLQRGEPLAWDMLEES
ncbi:MAG: SAF domain-containing protein [Phenylobacterium sp.]|uniref:SAF domain-containing protein n=1 Tax=Phenylobacterium sp. TaxID=1871053 RepID=UPI00271962FE|nr:SAF domain-containing protein [Phenylobacterium sp.]MDO8902567.1 SAF domain-containing protein [Phenylobacterium sp.]